MKVSYFFYRNTINNRNLMSKHDLPHDEMYISGQVIEYTGVKCKIVDIKKILSSSISLKDLNNGKEISYHIAIEEV